MNVLLRRLGVLVVFGGEEGFLEQSAAFCFFLKYSI